MRYIHLIKDTLDFAWKATKFFCIYTYYEIKDAIRRHNMRRNTEFNWKLTLKKAVLSAVLVFIAGLIAYMEQEPLYLALVPIVEAGRNYIKHRWNWD
jgi:hypothetical protein